jgi:two-component sensor histidine kinase
MAVDGEQITTEVDSVHSDVPGEIAVPIALFTVEALMNIFKYAFPSGHTGGSVKVRLERKNDELQLTIEDDGVGYIADTMKPGIGSRLLGVFARQVHGTASVDTQPGHGTKVQLKFADPEPAPTAA